MSSAPLPAPPRPSVISRLRRFWPVLPLAAILFALMLSDLDVMGFSPLESNACSLNEAEQTGISARLYAPLAQWALRDSALASTHVAIVTIDEKTEPPGLLTNTCTSREFLARLVRDLNTFGARVIMIDKYYSVDSCADAAATSRFVASLQASSAHIVVGQHTVALADNSASGCLALAPRLEFTSGVYDPKTCKICYGLNRANSDVLKVPLRWPVFNDPPSSDPAPIQAAMSLPTANAVAPTPVSDPALGDGLALVAAQSFDPAITSAPKLVKLLASSTHPYTTFFNLPATNAMTVLCNAEPAHIYDAAAKSGSDLCLPWVLKDAGRINRLKDVLRGKVIAVGDLSEEDMHDFPGGERPGIFLQANYVQSILDQRFLVEIPLWLTLVFLVLFVIGVYCLHWAHDIHGSPRFSAEQAGLLSLSIFSLLIATSLFVLFEFHYFTPLWALWGAGLFMIFKYLESSGHHRSQHLLSEIAGELHHPHEP